MKEIYILDTCYNPTAASNNRLFSYAMAWNKQGVKTTFLYLFPYGEGVKCDRYLDEINYVYLWEGASSDNKYYNTVRSIWKLRKMLKPAIPIYVYSMINCLYFLQKKNIRVFHEQTENPEVVGKIGGIVGSFLYMLYKKAVKQVDFLFVITPALREKYIKEFNVDPAKAEVINMTVEKERFNNLPSLPPSNIISYCGYISEFKDGVSVLIKAFASVHLRHPEYKLQIIGPFSNKETELKLKALVDSLEIKDNVVFTGPADAESMPARLKDSKILALARPDNIQAKYGFATKIGEYLMTERPAILTRVGAVEDFLTDKLDCILAEPDNVEDFAEKLLWIIEHYVEAADIGRRGKETALRCFNSEIEAEKIYRRVWSEQ